jgi:hypothetical protein
VKLIAATEAREDQYNKQLKTLRGAVPSVCPTAVATPIMR